MGEAYITRRGGSNPLNFTVVGGATQPASPKENMIWVNTDVPITSYIFSATEPENPAAGMVWISVGTSSSVAFSATKKNPVMVYPISAKQYVGGAWVDVTAMSYQGGEWVAWIVWVDLNIANWGAMSGQTYSNSFTNDGNGNIVVSSSQGESNTVQKVGKYYKTKYDLTAHSKVIFKGTFSHGGNSNNKVYLGVTNNLSSTMNNGAAFAAITGNFETTIDVSGLTGEFYIGFTMLVSAGTTNKLTITEIILG